MTKFELIMYGIEAFVFIFIGSWISSYRWRKKYGKIRRHAYSVGWSAGWNAREDFLNRIHESRADKESSVRLKYKEL